VRGSRCKARGGVEGAETGDADSGDGTTEQSWVSCTDGVASEALDGIGGVLGCVGETGGLRGSGLTKGDTE
jgi:hypothetical protein